MDTNDVSEVLLAQPTFQPVPAQISADSALQVTFHVRR